VGYSSTATTPWPSAALNIHFLLDSSAAFDAGVQSWEYGCSGTCGALVDSTLHGSMNTLTEMGELLVTSDGHLTANFVFTVRPSPW
jgi:hypothetical protein